MKENPLAAIEKGLVLFQNAFFASYLLINFSVLYWGSSDAFQRLGSLWVALLLLVFGLVKLVLDQIQEALEGRGLFVDKVNKKLGHVLYSENKGRLNYQTHEGVPFERRLYRKSEVIALLSESRSRIFGTILSNELLLGVLATLQWGYGDLLHCWIHGNGWETC